MSIDFAAPHWFLLVLILPFVVGLKIWSRQYGNRVADRMVAKRLQGRLLRRVPPLADWLLFGVHLVAILCLIAAAARPQWGYREIETATEGRNVFLAIDTSRSMLAEDVRPNRLERAKRAAQDLVRNLPSDRVGLIAFAGRPFVLAPLTVDHEAVLEAIWQLDTEVVPRGGTNLAKPALMALDAMAEAETSLAALVLFSDGEDHEGEAEFSEFRLRAQDSGLLVISVGVGTAKGAILQDPSRGPGHFVRDGEGRVVRSRLEAGGVRRLSEATDGLYVTLGNRASISQVVGEALQRLDTQQLKARETRVPVERYWLPLVLGLTLLVVAHVSPMAWFARVSSRQPERLRARAPAATAAVVFLLCLLGGPGGARVRAAEDAWNLYRSGEYVEAQARFMRELAGARFERDREALHFGLGAAAYRSGDYEGAKHAFAEVLLSDDPEIRERAHYNLGNTLYEAGRDRFPDEIAGAIAQMESAVRHYEATLRLNPGHRKAARNLEFVRDLLDKLRQLAPQQPDEPPHPQESPGDSPPEDPPEGDEPDPPEPPPSPPPGDQSPPPRPQPEASPSPDWSPEEARRILENNADEDKTVKPPQRMKFAPEGFKDW